MPPRGREGILDPGVASRFDACAGVRPAPGRAGRCAPPHRAGQEPGPRSARTRRDSRRRPVRIGAGWSTSPACRPSTGLLLHRLRHGACSPAASLAGLPTRARGTGPGAAGPPHWPRATNARTGHRLRTRRPPGRRSGRARTTRAATSRVWSATATTAVSTCPSPCTGRLVDEGTEASAGAVGSPYAGAAARAPGKPLQARGPFWRDGPWRDRDDPRGRHRPIGELVQPVPAPT